MNKKALSPLVATILLIAFAVSLGTMIMSWSFGSSDTTIHSLCDQTHIELQQLATRTAICYNTQQQRVQYLIKNNGETIITQFNIRVLNSQGNIHEQQIPTTLQPGQVQTISTPYNTLEPQTLVASILPVVNELTCAQKEIEQIQLPTC